MTEYKYGKYIQTEEDKYNESGGTIMKTVIKKRVVIGLICVVAGIIGLASNNLGLGGKPGSLVHKQIWELSGGQLKALSIYSAYDVQVDFVPSTDGKDTVQFEGKLDQGISKQLQQTTIQNDTLQLSLKETSNGFNLFHWDVTPAIQHITVALTGPAQLQQFNMHVSSAHTTLKNVTATNIQLQTSSGDVKAYDLKGKTQLATSSGDIRLEHWQGSTLDLASGSGDIYAQRLDGDVHTNASSGETEIQQLGGEGHIESQSGDILITLQKGARNLEASAQSGDIEIHTNHQFEGSYEAHTNSGDVEVPPNGTNSPYMIKANTSSGDIEIE